MAAVGLLEQAESAMAQGGILLDLRTVEEYRSGHLPGAILVPTPHPPLSPDDRRALEGYLQLALGTSPTSRPIVLYCKKGIRSGIAAEILRRFGFTRITDLGGLETEPLRSRFRQPR